MYGLRKINKDGIHHNFQWPLEVGAVVIAPDWNPVPECGGGLHLLPNAHGNYKLLNGHYWAVVEFDESKMVMIDNKKAKVPECKIVYISESPDGLIEFFKNVNFDSRNAYLWAMYIGDKEHMKQFITNSEYAYWWARNNGDEDHMKQFITEPQYAYYWAMYIGDKEHMKQFLTNSEYAYLWTCSIGDCEYMKQFVIESQWATLWARYIGDVEYMKQVIR